MVCISARRSLCLGVLAAATLASVGSAWAEGSSAYPNPARQIRIIVPFTAGGSSDVQARMLADRLGRMWNQAVVVENKPGAGGHLGGNMCPISRRTATR
jgi:tripartite-type tricarboxylate transporter receptor subunit TctC